MKFHYSELCKIMFYFDRSLFCWKKIVLQDDKKYYELELVNRETNFNKMFSAAPNVGVLNPLNAVSPEITDIIVHYGTGYQDIFISVHSL